MDEIQHNNSSKVGPNDLVSIPALDGTECSDLLCFNPFDIDGKKLTQELFQLDFVFFLFVYWKLYSPSSAFLRLQTPLTVHLRHLIQNTLVFFFSLLWEATPGLHILAVIDTTIDSFIHSFIHSFSDIFKEEAPITMRCFS